MTRRLFLALVLLFGLAACSDDGAPAVSATTTTLTPSTTTTTAPETTTTTLTAFPPGEETLEHGGSIWAVVLAGSTDFNAPELAAAVEIAEANGYRTGLTDCDVGAPEALGLDDSAYTVSVYFTTEADARQALQAFQERGWEGAVAAEVQTYCGD